MTMSVGFILDITIICLLAVTIFYAFRLSMFLKVFRDGRADIQKLFIDLTGHIDRAEQAMQVMRDAADQSGSDLQKLLNESKALSDELRFMNEAGDSLAARLEKLAGRNKELVDLLEKSGGIGRAEIAMEEMYEEPPLPAREEKQPQQNLSDFLIHDRDFFEAENEDYPAEEYILEDEYDWPEEEDEQLGSQAEREFYQSMKRAQKKKAGGLV